MKLTGQASLDFLSWYVKNQDRRKLSLVQFKHMEFNVQFSVLVDFFESKGVFITISPCSCMVAKEGPCFEGPVETSSRAESRTVAIEKANELYNAKNHE